METPSVAATISSAWADAPSVFRSRPRFYWMWLAGAAVAGALCLLIPADAFKSESGPQITAAVVPAFVWTVLLASVVVYFILADAVRTIVPAFAMTPAVFFITLLLNMAYSMAVQFAAYVFIVPAFYIGPKLYLWVPNYLLTSTESTDVAVALQRAWRDTNNLYWPTLGFMLLSSLIATLLAVAAFGAGCIAIQFFAPSAIVAMPFMLAALMFLVSFTYLGWLRWAVAVRRHADALA
jgi:hypothetical protein